MKKSLRITLKATFVIGGLAVFGLAGAAVNPFGAFAKTATVTAGSSTFEGSGSQTTDYGFADNVQDGQILQCFCWSYNEIMEYLPVIAEQGFTAIQTSPVQVCKEQTIDDGTGNARVAKDTWWAYYQPAAFTVDDTNDNALGTPAEFEAMIEMAHQYGVKVLVDVVANHLGNQWVADSLCERAYYYEWEIAGMDKPASEGGYIPYTGQYWGYNNAGQVDADNVNASTTPVIDTYYYQDTMKFHPYQIQDNDQAGNVTQGNIGMMDLDTSDDVVQDAVADYLEELIDYGVDGFRFDAAKHIETPYDDISSDFWPTVMDRAYSRALTYGKDIYAYGEILNRQGIGRSLKGYIDYGVNITDSGIGHNIVENGGSGFSNFNSADGEDYANYTSNMVTWAESHDNYMGTQDTHNKSVEVINKSYAILGARKDFCTLYCARFEDYDTSTLGNVACLNGWSYDEVGCINKFHNYFSAKDAEENCYMYNGYTIVERYNDGSSDNGIVIVGNSGSTSVSCSHLSNGTYTDAVTGNTFTVSNGMISGTVGSSGVAVIYNGTGVVHTAPYVNASKASGTFTATSLSVKFDIGNASSATLTIDGENKGNVYDNCSVEIKNVEIGETVTLVFTVEGTDGSTLTKTFTYTRIDTSRTLTFANNYNWSNVYVYAWNSSEGTKNAAWPGVELSKSSTDSNNIGIYTYTLDLTKYDSVIFSDGNASQTVDINVLSTSVTSFMISGASNNKLTVGEYVAPTPVNPTTTTTPVTTTTTTVPTTTATTTTTTTTTVAPTTTSSSTTTTTTTQSSENIIMVDFENNYNWSTVYAYVWNSTTKAKAHAWPGTACDPLGTDTNGYSAYCMNVDLASYDSIIFSDGNGTQTVDLSLTSSTTGFMITGNNGKLTCGAYDFVAASEPESKIISVAFENNYNWSNVYAYVWNDSTHAVASAWPGVQAAKLGTDTDGYTAYTADVDLALYDHIIFSNGNGSQTADLALSSSTTGFKITGGSNKYTCGAYTFTEQEIVPTTITIYFENTLGWSNVYAYVWNDSTYAKVSAWPGTKMTAAGTEDGYTVYSIEVDYALYDHIIFSNGNGTQTVDLAFDSSTTGFVISGTSNGKKTCTSFVFE